MCAERRWRGRPVLALVVALLASGCASLPARPGQARRGAVLAFSPLSVPSQAARSAATGVYQGEASGSADGPSKPAPMGFRRGVIGRVVHEEGTRGSSGEGGAFACGGKALPSGWPRLGSSREVLAPFLACASPAEFVAMQRGVDMAALVESLTDWDAVRLGALGPLDARASVALGRKRAAFIVTSVERYGVPYSEVLALFVLHSAFDDELREVVQLLARDKQLGETLGGMPVVREELKRRGLALEGFPERGEQARDVLRGLGRAGRDMLSSSPASVEAQYSDLMTVKRSQLPPPYQAALDEVWKALTERHYAPGSVSAGAFDHLTFGVPVGFYHLAAGTGHGAYSLAQGKYEQATRELAPAALMVALYAGGKGARALVESNAGGRASLRRLAASEVEALKAVVKELEERFSPEVFRDILSFIRGDSRIAFFAATEGLPAVMAIYEARGNLPKAQALLMETASRESAKPVVTRGSAGKRSDNLDLFERNAEVSVAEAQAASRETSKDAATRGGANREPARSSARRRQFDNLDLFAQDAEVGATESARAKLFQAELEASGPRLPKDVKLLRQMAPKLEEPPPGVEQGARRWQEYVAYRKSRLKEIQDGDAVKGPLLWEGYQGMRDRYARGMAFERKMVAILEEDAAKPRAERTWLKDFDEPQIETHVGVSKVDLRYADVLVIEKRPTPGQPPRVETFSFKSRNLAVLGEDALPVQVRTDASNAMKYYGGTLKIVRDGMRQQAEVKRVRLVYEEKGLLPEDTKLFTRSATDAQKRTRVEVLSQ
ncbi:hypothetical protein FJV41_42405 [Myxococcus llanfairpwllgwyngyllgogerychwyrndrobwllllantysiliogogogochensis]|uniref:Lipoprotein n=1 Tax=Myxococcus llanfairpwllgwyngyllgogerychwyrndrobwllllantysiliogogogochensis TaxID=2590453 RepID=A0A540WLI1_9BACT|nr:hypothetical protein [Myxococcus llanfairpwllgwyngyllgogerychwyrndrobwllllantysiliogogogochensis]TQF09876.1 hypothetical protein FJV41_42405 [Myxococcus llanfairpwllgwyngyllgogerychwyrndrobwllllantysiliogogogochensis]